MVKLDTYLDKFTNVNGTLYFTADDGGHGYELWKSDGTSTGTVMVKDIYPGFILAASDPRSLTPVNGTLYFVANDGTHGYELWKSDGTAGGTVMVKDMQVNPSDPMVGTLISINNTLMFFTIEPMTFHLKEIWMSDGSAAGTVLGASMPADEILDTYTELDGKLLYSTIKTTDNTLRVYLYDGTTNTVLVSP